MSSENQQNYNFTKTAIENFAGFHNALKKVADRLVSEGYILKDGKLIREDNKTKSPKSSRDL
jgi:hypothetical protein